MNRISDDNLHESSAVQQMMIMASNPNCWNLFNTNPTRPSSSSSSPNFFYPNYNFLPSSSSSSSSSASSSSSSSWLHDHLPPPDSWTQLLMSGGCGSVGEEDDNEEQVLVLSAQAVDNNNTNIIKQESSVNSYGYANNNNYNYISSSHHQFHQPCSASSPKSSCLTSTNNILDFSNHLHASTTQQPLPDPSPPQCNSGGAAKKARVQASTTQSTFKVRKEKLGDRITALHQLVSPFGKTDTASVLLEAIGYIRFLQSQIEALSLPYLATASPNMSHQQHQQSVQGENNCIFPEDPGQLLNENCLKRKAAGNKLQEYSIEEGKKKDLRSRGLCLVPVSCTIQVGSENGADYWAPALGGGFR